MLGGCVINPVTGDRELALVSADQEIAIGEQQYAPSQQMQGGEYALDPELTSYVAGVGQKLAAVSDRQLPYEFVVLNSSVPNAWALPGGKIAVNRGLLTELDSEAELAAVLGHEIVHAAARHGALAMQRGLLLQGALLATQVAAQRSDYGSLAVGAASLGAQLLSMRNGRDAELESDLYGMRYMADRGLRPQRGHVVCRRRSCGCPSRTAAAAAGSRRCSRAIRRRQERVQKNRETAATLASGGDLGRERYQAATARLRERQAGVRRLRRRPRRARRRSTCRRRALGAGSRALAARAKAHIHALLGDIDCTRTPLRRRRSRTTATRSAATTISSTTTCRKASRIGNCANGKNRVRRSRRACELLPTADAVLRARALAEQRGDRASRARVLRAGRVGLEPRRAKRRRTRPCGSTCPRIPASTSKRAAGSTTRASSSSKSRTRREWR